MKKVVFLIVFFGLILKAHADTVECDVFSKKDGLKQALFVRVYLNEFYTYGQFNKYNNAEEEPTLYAPIQRMVYMEKSCHDDFYLPQCTDISCSFGLVRKTL